MRGRIGTVALLVMLGVPGIAQQPQDPQSEVRAAERAFAKTMADRKLASRARASALGPFRSPSLGALVRLARPSLTLVVTI